MSLLPDWLNHAVTAYDTKEFGDGDLLSHEWLEWALKLPKATTIEDTKAVQWVCLERVDTFRDYLLIERKTAIQNVRGKGYRIVPPAEQAEYAAREAMEHLKKGFARGEKLLQNTRLTELDAEEAKRHTDTHIRLAGLRDIVQRQRRNIFSLYTPPVKS